jgi:Ser/Thr protein kinase RdoA (MazF antagonist)
MDSLAAVYQKRLNLSDATFDRIEHEDAIVATIYRVTLKNGKQLILKICKLSRHYLREVYFLNYFSNKLPVPRIVQTVPPEEGIDGAVLMEYLPGTVLKIVNVTDELAFEMGSLLAQIHIHQTSGYGELIDPKGLKLNARQMFGLKFEEIMAECASHLPSSMIEKFQRYYQTHLELLNSVDGPCMVHRDFRPGNILVENGKIQGIIDWSSSVASFAEEDFCCMEHGEWSSNPSTKKSFLAGYATRRPVPHYIAIMPLLRLSKALHIIGFLVKSGSWDKSQARLYKSNRGFIENFGL